MNLANLGPVELRIGGRQLLLCPRGQRGVPVSLLADASRPVPIAKLTEQAWGDSPLTDTRTSIQSYITRPRRTLSSASDLKLEPVIERAQRSAAEPSAVDLLCLRAAIASARIRSSTSHAKAASRPRDSLGCIIAKLGNNNRLDPIIADPQVSRSYNRSNRGWSLLRVG